MVCLRVLLNGCEEVGLNPASGSFTFGMSISKSMSIFVISSSISHVTRSLISDDDDDDNNNDDGPSSSRTGASGPLGGMEGMGKDNLDDPALLDGDLEIVSIAEGAFMMSEKIPVLVDRARFITHRLE